MDFVCQLFVLRLLFSSSSFETQAIDTTRHNLA